MLQCCIECVFYTCYRSNDAAQTKENAVAISDNQRVQETVHVRRRGVKQEGKWWSDSQKIEAVTLWLTLGNLVMVSATTRIPEDTLRKWRATQWWKELAEEIKMQDKMQLSASAKNLVDKSLAVIADRLEQGDWIYDQKTGQMRRKPVSMKDALAVADRMIEQKEKLEKTSVVQDSVESVEAKLTRLMEKFAQVAAPVVTDVIYVEADSTKENQNAPNEERQAGLQLRQGISEEAGTGEESGGEECSEEDN